MAKKRYKDILDISHKNLSRVEFAKEISPLSRTGKRLNKAEIKDDNINESPVKYQAIFNDQKENE